MADALSRVQSDIVCLVVTVAHSDLEKTIKASYVLDNHFSNVLTQLHNNQVHNKYSLQNGLLRRKGKIVVGLDVVLKQKLINWKHGSPEGGHGGRDLTTKRLKALFHWKDIQLM